MATVITAGNATNGLSFTADNTGALEFKTGTGAGTTALTLSSSQIATFAGSVAGSTGTLYPIVSGTAVASTSGTSIDFTGIPSWVKRITVMFSGVSTNGSSNYQIQIGSGSVLTSGYASGASYQGTGQAGANASTGFLVVNAPGVASILSGFVTLLNITSNSWVYGSVISRTNEAYTQIGGGNVTLSGTLDRVRITTINGTDTFDAGSINILYE